MRHSPRSNVQKFWFSRSHHCLVRGMQNHRLQQQAFLTLTTDVLSNYSAAYVQSQVCCGTVSWLELTKESSSPIDWANQESVKSILTGEGDFNTRLRSIIN